jgi:hypothetical protein
MKIPCPSLDHLESALAEPGRGVIGLVDELLAASLQHNVRVEWQAGICRVSFLYGELPDRIEVPLRKSVVRAALARIAALCNERSPGSVSPYGGRGIVEIDAGLSRAIRAVFVNTPETQSLDLASVSPEVVSLVSFSNDKSSD